MTDQRPSCRPKNNETSLSISPTLLLDLPHIVFVGVLPGGVRQHYNKGGAPFPYAEQCTNVASEGTCDPAELMMYLTVPDSATPMSLDIDETSVAPEDGVGLVSKKLKNNRNE